MLKSIPVVLLWEGHLSKHLPVKPCWAAAIDCQQSVGCRHGNRESCFRNIYSALLLLLCEWNLRKRCYFQQASASCFRMHSMLFICWKMQWWVWASWEASLFPFVVEQKEMSREIVAFQFWWCETSSNLRSDWFGIWDIAIISGWLLITRNCCKRKSYNLKVFFSILILSRNVGTMNEENLKPPCFAPRARLVNPQYSFKRIITVNNRHLPDSI